MKAFKLSRLHISRSAVLWILLLVPLFVSVAYLQKKYDAIMHPTIVIDIEIKKRVLPSSFLDKFSFGFRNVLADYYWVMIIQDYAGWNRKDEFYIDEYRNLVTLDPKFAYPYLFGILTVPVKTRPGSAEKIEEIAKVGIGALPLNWEIPFYLSTQFHLLKNYEKALHYIEIAQERPNAPANTQALYKRYKAKTLEGNNASRAFIETIYDTTTSTTTRAIIREGMLISQITSVVENLNQKYKAQYGKYPVSIDELIQAKMLEIDSKLREEFDIHIDQNTGRVEVSTKEKS